MFCESVDTPIGPLSVIANDKAIIEIKFEPSEENKPNELTKLCIWQLKEYFEGKRKNFDLPLDPLGTAFQKKVWDKLQLIPFGKSLSYSDLAIQLGDIKSIRAAGTANGKNRIPIIIPCHRVIGKDGSLVGFAGGLDKKEWLLKHEGVIQGEQMNIFS